MALRRKEFTLAKASGFQSKPSKCDKEATSTSLHLLKVSGGHNTH